MEEEIKFTLTKTYYGINFTFFIFGMIGVWLASHNWWAMLAAFIASVHVSKTKDI